MPGWARRHGWLIAIACAYLYIFPYFPRLGSANEIPRAFLVKAIVVDHRFAIDDSVAHADPWMDLADVSQSGGHSYSNKAPGSAMLAAPAYAAVTAIAGEPSLGVTMWLCRLVTGIVPTLAFLVLLYGFLARFTPDPKIRKLVVIAYALGSMAMTYSLLYFSHQLGAVCIASAWILTLDVLDGKRGLRAMVAAGLLAGTAPLVDYQAVFAALPVVIYAIVRLRGDWSRLARVGGLAALGAIVPIAILLAYHRACFGSPWRTGYDASQTYAVFHQHGFLGLTRLRWEAFTGSTVSFDNGLVTLSPWLLLAIPGAVELVRRRDQMRGLAITSIAIAGVYLLFISAINFWRGGGEVGPRYITAILPFLLPLVAVQLETLKARPRNFAILAGTIIVGVAIYALSSATFPYWPESFRNPFRDVTLRLLANNLVAPNLGGALGLPGLLGLVPFVALVGGLVGWAIASIVGRRGLTIACAVAAVMIGVYCLVPGGALPHAYDYVRAIVAAGG